MVIITSIIDLIIQFNVKFQIKISSEQENAFDIHFTEKLQIHFTLVNGLH